MDLDRHTTIVQQPLLVLVHAAVAAAVQEYVDASSYLDYTLELPSY